MHHGPRVGIPVLGHVIYKSFGVKALFHLNSSSQNIGIHQRNREYRNDDQRKNSIKIVNLTIPGAGVLVLGMAILVI